VVVVVVVVVVVAVAVGEVGVTLHPVLRVGVLLARPAHATSSNQRCMACVVPEQVQRYVRDGSHYICRPVRSLSVAP